GVGTRSKPRTRRPAALKPETTARPIEPAEPVTSTGRAWFVCTRMVYTNPHVLGKQEPPRIGDSLSARIVPSDDRWLTTLAPPIRTPPGQGNGPAHGSESCAPRGSRQPRSLPLRTKCSPDKERFAVATLRSPDLLPADSGQQTVQAFHRRRPPPDRPWNGS